MFKFFGILLIFLVFTHRFIEIHSAEVGEIPSDNEFNLNFFRLFHRELDEDWNDQQMIEYRDFKYEAHNAVTEDCYFLELHRIVNPENKTSDKPPVLLLHGLLGSSTDFIFNSIGGNIHDNDDRNLGFALAKRGYDVWIGNIRGNEYSQRHKTFSKIDPEFFKFTFDNHAFQDLPAMISYIQNFTNYDQIGYVGYSQSTLMMFMLLSFKPQVAKSIRPFIAMGPIAYQGNIKSPFIIPSFAPTLLKALLFTNTEFLPRSPRNKLTSTLVCKPFPSLICENFLFTIFGYSSNQLNRTRVPVYVNHLPAGTSLANIIHMELNIHYKKLMLLDYLTEEQNMKCYNSSEPPLVPIENIIQQSMYIINGQNDLLSNPKDVQMLKDNLKVDFESKFIPNFEHLDFMLSQNSDRLLNNYIIEAINDKTPLMDVEPNEKLRLKQFTEETCTPPERSSVCHLDLKRALDNVY